MSPQNTKNPRTIESKPRTLSDLSPNRSIGIGSVSVKGDTPLLYYGQKRWDAGGKWDREDQGGTGMGWGWGGK